MQDPIRSCMRQRSRAPCGQAQLHIDLHTNQNFVTLNASHGGSLHVHLKVVHP